MVCSIVPEVFTDYSRPSAELTLVRLFQVRFVESSLSFFVSPHPQFVNKIGTKWETWWTSKNIIHFIAVGDISLESSRISDIIPLVNSFLTSCRTELLLHFFDYHYSSLVFLFIFNPFFIKSCQAVVQILNRVTASYRLFETLSRLHATGKYSIKYSPFYMWHK